MNVALDGFRYHNDFVYAGDLKQLSFGMVRILKI
jgi:hypothetical protein